jgi:hypothetical protein
MKKQKGYSMENWILETIKEEERKNKSIDYEALFYSIAKKLMSEYNLKINEDLFGFTEVEFYYYHKNLHSDCSVHQHDFQKEQSIYFHDKHARGGVDIGFGDENCWGGILLRGIKLMDRYINGPINVADEFCKVLKSEYNNLTEQNLLKKQVIKLIKNTKIEKTIFCAPRVGLSSNNDFLIRNYRFIIDFIVEHKFQEKSLVYLASHACEFSRHAINDIPNFKIATILKGLEKNKNRLSRLHERYKAKEYTNE